jgi:LPXTG-motif cell wall-anchored protein
MRRPIHPQTEGTRRRFARTLAIPAVVASVALLAGTFNEANAGVVPTVLLATAANYSVLGGQTVTNTGPSILDKSLGVSPGSAVTGFPPGTVTAPGTIQAANAVALQAQSDLTTAYNDAFARITEFNVPSDLTLSSPLIPGVYSSGRGPLALSGNLTLNGGPDAVFIFQTDSTLTTASASSITMIGGMNECNVFWQVGSSAIIGTDSVFVGNVMALTSISLGTNATIQGRMLARNGATTLDSNVFSSPACAFSSEGPPPATTTTVAAAPAPVDTTPLGPITPGGPGGPGATLAPGVTVPGFDVTDITLPRTGNRNVAPTSAIGAFALILGAGAIMLARRRRPAV